jgi:hypothetical protein
MCAMCGLWLVECGSWCAINECECDKRTLPNDRESQEQVEHNNSTQSMRQLASRIHLTSQVFTLTQPPRSSSKGKEKYGVKRPSTAEYSQHPEPNSNYKLCTSIMGNLNQRVHTSTPARHSKPRQTNSPHIPATPPIQLPTSHHTTPLGQPYTPLPHRTITDRQSRGQKQQEQ